MQINNDTGRIRLKVLTSVAGALVEKDLERLDQIPVKLRPRSQSASRCCVYYDRAVLRYRVMGALGHGMDSERDESCRLSSYVDQPTANEDLLAVIDIACDRCRQGNYLVTNACRGCVARPCKTNCPKDAVTMVQGQAVIDPDKCISCGKCKKLCPFQAIVQVEVPCEKECPVGAIKRGPDGRQMIDESQCIYCGKCLKSCPFGAVMERSQLKQVITALQSAQPVVALVAPAVEAHFPGTLLQMLEAVKQCGFDGVYEVALGAEQTMQEEALELLEAKAGNQLLTTSCCPAYVAAVDRHVPSLKTAVSHTPSPMAFTAKQAKTERADAFTVFIGPCLAKRHEALNNAAVDAVLTFEELGALLVAKGIYIRECSDLEQARGAEPLARGFRASGGVTASVLEQLSEEQKRGLHVKQIDGLDRKTLKQLPLYAMGKLPADFLEVMACPGGCVKGPCGFAVN